MFFNLYLLGFSLYGKQEAWTDFYGPEEPGLQFVSQNERIDPDETASIYISQCTFANLNGGEYAGAIRLVAQENTLIEYSTFTRCSAQYGGAISLSYIAQIACQFLTATQNTASSSYAFCMLTTRDDSSIAFHSSSISSHVANCQEVTTLRNGNITVKSNNATRNEVRYYSAFYIDPTDTANIHAFSSFKSFKIVKKQY